MTRDEARACFRAFPKTWQPLAPHLDALLLRTTPSEKDLEDGKRRAERLGTMFQASPELGCVDYEVIGSVARRTANGPLADVDLMVILEETAWRRRGGRYAPATVLREFRERLRQRYGELEKAGYVDLRDQPHSVGLRFSSQQRVNIDVVPAFRVGGGELEIPERGTGRWVLTRPAAQLETLNRLDLRGQPVRRAVRLLKLWRAFGRGPALPAVAVEVLVLYARAHGAPCTVVGLVESTMRWMASTGLRTPISLVAQPVKRAAFTIFDTGVRENNLVRGLNAARRDAIVARAEETLEDTGRLLPRLESGSDWGVKGFLSKYFRSN